MNSKIMIVGSIGLAGFGISLIGGDPVWSMCGVVCIGIAIFMCSLGEEKAAQEDQAKIEWAKKH